jgi:extracellular elastinolytic metalloproteinase
MRLKLRRPVPVLAAALVALVFGAGSTSAPHAGSADAHRIAVDYLSKNAADHGVTRADVADLFVTSKYRSSASGVTHVNMTQRYQDLEVFGGHVTVNVAGGGSVIFAGGSLVAGLSAATTVTPALDAVAAVEAAADALDLDEPKNLRVLSRKGGKAQETVVSDGGISDAAIPAKLGWQPTANGLRLAWQLVIDETSEESLWKANVDANTGALLESDDWTVHDDLGDLASTLSRSSQAAPAAIPALPENRVQDGSSYRVLGIPTESPNDHAPFIVENPADVLASPFGWHDTNGAAGAEFTITRGNSTHAYLDQEDNEAPDFGDTGGGPGLDFDYPADLTEHAQFYRDAVVTNLFYGCNAFHDIYYRYGFTEAAGNFQANNYGRGGLEGDYVRCEAADGSGTNNANFSTPTEPTATGAVPRMQMFLWPGNQLGAQNEVLVNGVTSIGAGWARFGPPATKAGVTGGIVLVNDGVATPPVGTANDGCEPYGPLPAGSIAMVDRANAPPAPPPDQPPTCSFLQQVQNAHAAGAVAVIIANNTDGNAPIVNGPTSNATPPIPTVSLTQDNGNALKALLPASGIVRKHPNHPGIRDGDLENGIIFHEYGHGLSNRLTGGPAVNCLTGNEQAGEGWSDYVALAALLDPALDDPAGPRGMGPYALFQNSRKGNGIRPRPYSRTMEIQPFTYDSIKTSGWLSGASLALPHGLGHGWAAVLWDMTWDLIDKHGFSGNVYAAWDSGGNNRGIQYVVEGLKLQGCGPGLVVARDAIIAAANQFGGGPAGGLAGDTCTVWASFARRGLGHSAVQGTTNRNDNDEAFDTRPDCRRGFLSPITPDTSYPALNQMVAGDARPLRFTADGQTTLDLLASNSPYSRKVDCTTFKPVQLDPPRLTPKAYPEATTPPGKSGLTINAQGVYHYSWKTDTAWAGTCREFVLTRTDGKQHRAFFSFTAS